MLNIKKYKNSAKILGNLLLDHVEGSLNEFIVARGFEYNDEKYSITIKPGLKTDGASVPRIFWCLFPPIAGRYLEASVLHDGLYRSHLLSKEESDLIFLKAMLSMGVPDGHALLIYNSVKYGGKFAWNSYSDNMIKDYRKYVEVKNISYSIKEFV